MRVKYFTHESRQIQSVDFIFTRDTLSPVGEVILYKELDKMKDRISPYFVDIFLPLFALPLNFYTKC